jgi:hypothetical protein
MTKSKTKPAVRGNIHVQIDKALHEQLNDYCYQGRYIKGAIVEEALRAYLKGHARGSAPAPVAATPRNTLPPVDAGGQLVRHETAAAPRPSGPPAGLPPQMMAALRELKAGGEPTTIANAAARIHRKASTAIKSQLQADEITQDQHDESNLESWHVADRLRQEYEAIHGTGPLL